MQKIATALKKTGFCSTENLHENSIIPNNKKEKFMQTDISNNFIQTKQKKNKPFH